MALFFNSWRRQRHKEGEIPGPLEGRLKVPGDLTADYPWPIGIIPAPASPRCLEMSQESLLGDREAGYGANVL